MFAWFVPPIVIPAAIVAYFVALVLYRHFEPIRRTRIMLSSARPPSPYRWRNGVAAPTFLRCINFCYG
jgi:hypothetical protein